MNKEQERFECLMSRYFPSLPLEKDNHGDYKNTHVMIASAMYLWGVTDGEASTVKINYNVSSMSGGWAIELPPKEWLEINK